MNRENVIRRASPYFASLAIVALAGAGQAATINIPGDFSTIQAGIDEAVNGDTVLVEDGIYDGDGNRDIDFLGKMIVLMSQNGPGNCIIDCGGWPHIHHGFQFHSGENPLSAVKGFTIRNAWAYGENGGAIYCDGSSPTIQDNVITGNLAYSGGGIYCYNNSHPIIRNNRITANTASLAGGICCDDNSSPTIIGNLILGNTADLYGGGIYCRENSSPEITGNTVTANTSRWGSGISCDEGTPTITENTITSNTASQAGGGIHCDSSSVTIVNSILWNDSPDEIVSVHNSDLLVTFSDVDGGWEGEGNIDADPLFILPGRLDYRLFWSSPCIDTGLPGSVDPDLTRCDIGAHFFDQEDYLTLYVTPDTEWVRQDEELSVTYTVINRWDWSQLFYASTRVALPGGYSALIIGPVQFTIPGNYSTQIYIHHYIPLHTPVGEYEYQSTIGQSPSLLFDRDNFTFQVIEEAAF